MFSCLALGPVFYILIYIFIYRPDQVCMGVWHFILLNMNQMLFYQVICNLPEAIPHVSTLYNPLYVGQAWIGVIVEHLIPRCIKYV